MKKSKTFNNISNELQKSIPRLKQGEIKTFLMLNGVPNPDPDRDEQSKYPMVYGKKQLRTNFRIYDENLKGDNGEKIGGYVSIGAVERWNGDEPDKFYCIVPGQGETSRFSGKFSLTGGKVEDEELWEVLWLSPEREGTPFPDPSIPPLFRLLDFTQQNKFENSKFEILSKAIDLAKTISEEKGREVLAAMNKAIPVKKEEVEAEIRKICREKPEDFIKAYESADAPTMLLIKTAMEKGVLDHDMQSGKVRLGGIELTTLKIEPSEPFVPNFVQWINNSENSKNVLNNIKGQIKKADEIKK